MPEPGDRIDRYVVERRIGGGGMGDVYEATDTKLDRRVALKVIRDAGDETARKRMLREARAAAAFDHPNAIVVFDVGETPDFTWIAMELVAGASLRAHVGDAGVPVERKLRWACEAARALAAAHRAGLVHRDVKPDNVMIRDDGVAKVLDFGIARRQRSAQVDATGPTQSAGSAREALETLTAEGVIVGTPLYLAPEQLRGDDIDGRADQFAWGVTTYELLAGTPPWGTGADGVTLLSRILTSPAPPLRERVPAIPAQVENAVMRALEKSPVDRFPSLDDAADEIAPFAEVVTSSAARRSRVPAASSSPSSDASGSSSSDARPAPTTGAPISAARPPPQQRFGRGARLAVAGITIAAAAASTALWLHARGGVASRSPAIVAPLEVRSLGCAPARIDEADAAGATGGDTTLALVLGYDACARIATDLGVRWTADPTAAALSVETKLGPDGADVVLRIGDRSASAHGAAPIDAVVAAAAPLEAQLSAPPMTPERVAAWGAKDEASARRIERMWRRVALHLSGDRSAEIREAMDADPGSPWPPLALASAAHGPSPDAIAKGLANVDRLPPARAAAVRGALLFGGTAQSRDEALPLLRRAYTDAGDDPDIATLYLTVLAGARLEDEAVAVFERMRRVFPEQVAACGSTILTQFENDPARNERVAAEMVEAWPEARVWAQPIMTLAAARRFDDARASIALGERLGLLGREADASWSIYTKALVELAAGDAEAARQYAAPGLGDPRAGISAHSAWVTIAAYWLEGRATQAESATLAEMDRQAQGGLLRARPAVAWLAYHRWLRRPGVTPERVEALEKDVAGMGDRIGSTWASPVESEVALARLALGGKGARASAARALADMEARARAASADDPRALQKRLVGMLALVRAVRGDAAAAALWRDTPQATNAYRELVAIDAGLALESSGDSRGAEAAYVLARDSLAGRDVTALAVGVAPVRLAELYRRQGRAGDAAAADAAVARLWSRADAGFVDAVRAMR